MSSDKKQIYAESKKRVKAMKFADPMTNICAGKDNPFRHCYFVRYHPMTDDVTCTDGKGIFIDIDINSAYPGTLDANECKRLFNPIWKSKFEPELLS
jgi:hypothetical protein